MKLGSPTPHPRTCVVKHIPSQIATIAIFQYAFECELDKTDIKLNIVPFQRLRSDWSVVILENTEACSSQNCLKSETMLLKGAHPSPKPGIAP